MRNNLIRITVLAALLAVLTAAAAVFLRQRLPAPAPQAEEMLHGRALYDSNAALPPQAMLDIKLAESPIADNGGQSAPLAGAVVAEIKQPLFGARAPLDWALPVPISALSRDKTYVLQARISSGDSLLFVSAAPQMVEMGRAAYVLRLDRIDDGTSDSAAGKALPGRKWQAEMLLGKAPEQGSDISLIIDDEAKIDPANAQKRYGASGFGGCNRFMGSALIDESKKTLQFSLLPPGLIVCAPAIARQEADFFDMLSKTRFNRQEGSALILLDDAQTPLARFAAR